MSPAGGGEPAATGGLGDPPAPALLAGGSARRLVVERSLLERLGGAAPCIDVVARRPARGGRWRPIDADAAVATLLASGPRPVALARTPEADPGGSCLPALAAILGLDRVRLPDHADAAAWCVGVAAAWCAAGEGALCRRLQALAGAISRAARGDRGLPVRQWGIEGVPVPALRPAVLARWAGRAWHPCRWCAGGGLLGTACGSCGVPLPGPAAAAHAPTLAGRA